MFLDVVDIIASPMGENILAIKMLAQGRICKPGHITVRGPFRQPTSTEELESLNVGLCDIELKIGQSGSFLNERSRVVFLKCQAPDLLKVWYKPDYPVEKYGFNPHVTIFDGPDGAFAESLYLLLKRYDDRSFEICLPKLSSLLPTPEYVGLHQKALRLIGCEAAQLDKLHDEERLQKIEKFLQRIFML